MLVIKMNNVILEQVCTYKYLGVLVDDALSFKMHVMNVIKNVSHKVYMLGKIRPKLTETAAIMVYKSMILPLFDIGNVFYIGACQQSLSRLRVLQNKALRIIFRIDPRESTLWAMNKIKIMPLDQRRALHVIQLIKWIKECGTLEDKRNLPTRAHATDRKMLIVNRPRTVLYQRSFIYRACVA